jgi:ABC-type sugar transport system permease subunit
VYIYREAFRNFRVGDASAMAIVGAALSVLVSLAYFMMERRRERS